MGHKRFAISKYQLGAGKLSTVLTPMLTSVALDKPLPPPHLTTSQYVFSTLSGLIKSSVIQTLLHVENEK